MSPHQVNCPPLKVDHSENIMKEILGVQKSKPASSAIEIARSRHWISDVRNGFSALVLRFPIKGYITIAYPSREQCHSSDSAST